MSSKRWMVAGASVALVAAVAAGGALVLRGGGGGDASPAALRISPNSQAGGGREATATMASAAAGDKMMVAPYFREEYVLGGELPALDDDAMAWSSQRYTVTAEDAARIAAALGVTGEPVQQEWGAWTVGPTDGTGPNVTVNNDALGSWWYSNPSNAQAVACSAAGVAVDPRTISSDPAVSGPAIDPGTVSNDPAVSGPAIDPDMAPEGCTEPTPPSDLLSDEAAAAEAERLSGALGASGDQTQDVTRDDWGVNVDRKLVLGGVETTYWSTFRFGAGGQLEWANGYLGSFQEAGAYARIGTAAAFANLQAGQPFPWYSAVPMPLAADTAGGGAAVSGPAVGAAEPSAEPSLEPGALVGPTPSDVPQEITAVDPAVTPAVEPRAMPPVSTEVRTVTITGVEPALTPVDAADGGVILVPTYRFLSSDGGQYDVLAVPDEAVQVVPAAPVPAPTETTGVVPEPAPVPVTTAVPGAPVPGETVPGGPALPGDTTGDPNVEATVPDQAIAAAYLGLTEEAALKQADAEGRPARVASRDGEQLALTADYLADRVNLVIVGGVVTDAKLG